MILKYAALTYKLANQTLNLISAEQFLENKKLVRFRASTRQTYLKVYFCIQKFGFKLQLAAPPQAVIQY